MQQRLLVPRRLIRETVIAIKNPMRERRSLRVAALTARRKRPA